LAFYLVLRGYGKTLAGLIVGVLLMDVGVQAGHVANQTRIYSLAPDARSRLNMFYMVCYFAGGAAGSFLGAYAWRIYGWTGVCAFCLGVMLIALFRFSAGRATVGSPGPPAPPAMISKGRSDPRRKAPRRLGLPPGRAPAGTSTS
jgi:predicted MFS family arabinose efflux permease